LGTILKTLRISSTSTMPKIYWLIIPITPSSISRTTPVLSLIFSSSSRRALIRTLRWNSTLLDLELA
jgi:type IV secretory pathway TraG/TraD family ATPase VirD4